MRCGRSASTRWIFRTRRCASGRRSMRLTVNGVARSLQLAGDTPLLYALRNDLRLVGTRFGCGNGQCGACMVLVDGRPATSCNTPLWSLEDKAVTTVEGLGEKGALHPVQEALI